MQHHRCNVFCRVKHYVYHHFHFQYITLKTFSSSNLRQMHPPFFPPFFFWTNRLSFFFKPRDRSTSYTQWHPPRKYPRQVNICLISERIRIQELGGIQSVSGEWSSHIRESLPTLVVSSQPSLSKYAKVKLDHETPWWNGWKWNIFELPPTSLYWVYKPPYYWIKKHYWVDDYPLIMENNGYSKSTKPTHPDHRTPPPPKKKARNKGLYCPISSHGTGIYSPTFCWFCMVFMDQ